MMGTDYHFMVVLRCTSFMKYSTYSALARLSSYEQLLLLFHIAGFPMVNRKIASGIGQDVYEKTNSILKSPKKLKDFITEEQLNAESMKSELFKNLHYLVNGSLLIPEPTNLKAANITIDVQVGLRDLFIDELENSFHESFKGTSIAINPMKKDCASTEHKKEHHVGEVFIKQCQMRTNNSDDFITMDLHNYERILITHPENPIFEIREEDRNIDTWKEHRFFWMVGIPYETSEIYQYFINQGYSHDEVMSIFGKRARSLEEVKNRILLNEEIFVCSSTFMKAVGGTRLNSKILEQGMREISEVGVVQYRFPKNELTASYWPFVAKAILAAILNKRFKFGAES